MTHNLQRCPLHDLSGDERGLDSVTAGLVCVGMVFPIFTKHIPNDYYIHTEASARRNGRCKWREMDKKSLRSQRSVRRQGKEVIDWAGNESVAACLHLRKSAVVFLLARRIAAVVFLLLRLNTRQTEAIQEALRSHHEADMVDCAPSEHTLAVKRITEHHRTFGIFFHIHSPRAF